MINTSVIRPNSERQTRNMYRTLRTIGKLNYSGSEDTTQPRVKIFTLLNFIE